MTVTARRLVPGSQLTGAAAAYYTAPTGTRAVLKSVVLTNTTVGAVLVTVYLVPSGGAVGAATTLISALSLATNVSYTCPELVNQVIEAGGSLQALGLNVTLVASGVEIA
jgi:hypothetical protein